MTQVLFTVKNLRVNFGEYPILTIPELQIQKDKITAIIGPNGAGKSTLLKALIGQYPCQELQCLGQSAALLLNQGKIAWVGQHESFASPLSVKDYVLLGRYPHLGWLSRPNQKDVDQAKQLLAEFELAEAFDKRLSSLSGGEKQRAALVRALMQDTHIMLLDEPNNHLDIKHQHQLMQQLQKLKKQGMSAVIVLHDLSLAANYCDEIILMAKGKVLAQGQTPQVMTAEALQQAYQWQIKPYQHQNVWYFDSFQNS